MLEKSLGTKYNVSHSYSYWARIRVSLWNEEQREAIRREFDNLAREEHGKRCLERQRKNTK